MSGEEAALPSPLGTNSDLDLRRTWDGRVTKPRLLSKMFPVSMPSSRKKVWAMTLYATLLVRMAFSGTISRKKVKRERKGVNHCQMI